MGLRPENRACLKNTFYDSNGTPEEFKDERRRHEWFPQREQRRRDELYTKRSEMLAAQQEGRAEGPLATLPRDIRPVANDAFSNDSHSWCGGEPGRPCVRLDVCGSWCVLPQNVTHMQV